MSDAPEIVEFDAPSGAVIAFRKPTAVDVRECGHDDRQITERCLVDVDPSDLDAADLTVAAVMVAEHAFWPIGAIVAARDSWTRDGDRIRLTLPARHDGDPSCTATLRPISASGWDRAMSAAGLASGPSTPAQEWRGLWAVLGACVVSIRGVEHNRDTMDRPSGADPRDLHLLAHAVRRLGQPSVGDLAAARRSVRVRPGAVEG